MRAAVHDHYGPPEVVSIRDVPVPTISADELLVEVHATTVNQTDAHYRSRVTVSDACIHWSRSPKTHDLGM